MYICVWIHARKASWRALLIGLAALFHERQHPGLDRKIHFEAHFHLVDALRYFTRTQKGTCFEFFVFWGFEFLVFLGIADADKGGGNLSLEPKGLWQCRCGDVYMDAFIAGHHWKTKNYIIRTIGEPTPICHWRTRIKIIMTPPKG